VGHLAGVEATEELAAAAVHALGVFDLVKQVFPHTRKNPTNSFQLPLVTDSWKYGQHQEQLA
jgi:hypothetical protein